MVDEPASAFAARLRWPSATAGAWALAGAVLGLTLVRLWLASVQPLWFDESWTAMVAATPWRELPHILKVDPNPPLYYLVMRAWAALAGTSDLALRLPGLAAVALTAWLPTLMKTPGLGRGERLAWGWLMFAWWGVDQFLLARGFPVLLALSAAQLILFLRLLEQPRTGRALAWTCVSVAAVMVHYYAAPLALVQGLIYLAVHRRDAVRTWPAALALVPALAWVAYHWPFLRQFTDAQIAWHQTLDASGVLAMIVFPLHHTAPVIALAVVALLALGMIWRGGGEGAIERALRIAAAASWIALLIVLASAAWRPTLIARYLTPAAPGVLLTLVLLTRRTSRPRAVLAGVCGLYLVGLTPAFAMIRGPDDPSPYGHERASQVLMRRGVTDVVFLWDHETIAVQDHAALTALGRFYFDRAGAPVRVIAPTWRAGEDLNRVALSAAAGEHPGIIWIYNRNTQTAARAHPPAIQQLDPTYACESIGYEGLGSVACYRRP